MRIVESPKLFEEQMQLAVSEANYFGNGSVFIDVSGSQDILRYKY